jgi:flagellar secretion chaperone FliS
MNPHTRYRTSTAYSWTRIDMLLMIYEKLVHALQEGVRLLEKQQTRELVPVQIQVQRCITLIADGLDLSAGDVPRNVARLCLFTVDNTRADSLEGWQASLRVMSEVRDGFQQIQDEARELEHSGKIPAIDLAGY